MNASVHGNFLKSMFKAEWTWRLFIVLEGIAALFVIILDVTEIFQTEKWDFFPDFFTSFYWQFGRSNWYVVYAALAAFLIAKSIDWVSEGRSSDGPNK